MSYKSWGTYVSDGLRSGPIYTQQITGAAPNGGPFPPPPINFNQTPYTPNQYGVLTSNNYNNWGPGMLYSPQNSYNINPAPPGAGFTTLNNIVAQVGGAGGYPAGNLTLAGDNSVSYLTTASLANNFNNVNPSAKPYIQLDWPRVITVTISGANATANTHVTILGIDYYEQPMQHTYIVAAQQTYPIIALSGNPAQDGTISLPCKAFYRVTGVILGTPLPANCLLSVGASEVFGLPFVVRGTPGTAGQNTSSSGVITSIAWGTQTGGVAQPIIPVDEMTVRVLGNPRTTRGIFVPADITNPPTALTGDTRGLYKPSSAVVTQVVGGNIVNSTRLVFTTYVAGEDVWINQIAELQQSYKLATGSPTPQGLAVNPLFPALAFGRPQFYTGQSS